MDWLKNALGMAGAYTIARSFLDRDAAKWEAIRQDQEIAQAEYRIGQQMEALVSDIDDVIVDELNAALLAPASSGAIVRWARGAGPRLRRYRDRWGTWWGRAQEGDELVERWQRALDAYIEAVDLIRADDPDGWPRLVRAIDDYKVFQAWLRARAIAIGWKPEE